MILWLFLGLKNKKSIILLEVGYAGKVFLGFRLEEAFKIFKSQPTLLHS